MDIKQEPADDLDLSIVKEEFTIEEIEPGDGYDGYDHYDDNFIIPEDEKEMVQVKIENMKNETESNKKIFSKMGRPKKSEYKCSICAKTFEKSRNLSQHVKTHSNAKAFECTQCSKSFTVRKYLSKHIKRSHKEQPPATCKICDKTFKNGLYLKSHLYRHRSYVKKRCHQCEICCKRYSSEAEKMHHISKVHEAKEFRQSNPISYICADCGRIYQRKGCYKTHLLTHSDITYTCALCTREFKGKELLEKHLMDHMKKKLLICKFCNLSFSSTPYYERHVAKHTREKGPVQCFYCDMIFLGTESRYVHIKGLHLGLPTKAVKEDAPVACTICKMVFDDLGKLKEHAQEAHQGRYECSFCDEKFPMKQFVYKHIMEKHEGKKSNYTVNRPGRPNSLYTCPHCDKSFTNISVYKDHQAYHSEGRPFVCLHCPKSFKVKTALNMHMQAHRLVASYECHECGEKFKIKCHFLNHQRKHGIMERDLDCVHCKETFKDRDLLNKHVKLHHKDLKPTTSSAAIKPEENPAEDITPDFTEDPHNE